MSEILPTATDSIEAKILRLGEPESEPGHEGPPSPVIPPSTEPARPQTIPAVERPASPESSVVRYSFTFPKPIWKAHNYLLEISDPAALEKAIRAIKGIDRGRFKGCQCWTCKETRGEIHRFEGPATSSQTILDPLLSDLMTEEFCGKVADLPNRAMQFFCELRKYPPEIQDLWTTPKEELELYGRYCKVLADHYLKLPDFKHKELIVVGSWYGLNFSMKLGFMTAMLKTMGKLSK